jgi:hypothetical protein
MRKDAGDGLRPSLEEKSKCLWARPSDIDVDASAHVMLNRKGISVSDDWRTLPPHLIPIELDDGVNGACGKGMAVFVHGQNTGPFAEAAVTSGLAMYFKVGTTKAGNICPVASVPLAHYQRDLAATQSDWVIDAS